MTIKDEPANQDGLAFLESLESKHNQVLDELDMLNERIEAVLNQYLESRQSSVHAGDSDRKAA